MACKENSRDPRDDAWSVANDLYMSFKKRENGKEMLKYIINDIEDELDWPKQNVSEILEFAHPPSEQVVREFLRMVYKILKDYSKKYPI